MIPKIEPDHMDVDNLTPTLTNPSIKLELESDFSMDMDAKVLCKVNADYDEWLEIQN